MFYKKPLLGIAAACTILLSSSCKKDVISDEQTAAAVVSSDATTADNTIETASPLTQAITTYVSSDCAGYYEVLPSLYSKTTKKYPFILFIHGIGELGTGPARLTCCGLPYYANKKQFPADFVVNGQHFSFVVMAPQFKTRPTAAQIQEVFNYAVKKYRIDPTRMYIAGLSMGGGSTWDYSAVYGKNVAAAVPVCGGTAPTTALASGVAASGVPVWTISSKTDAVVPISWAINWVNWIKADNPANAANVMLTEYTSGETHNDTWYKATNPATTVNGYNIYSWMLRYQRVNGRIVVMAGASVPSSPTTPTTPTSGAITANAGADETIDLAWKYSPLLNATLSKDNVGGWFTSTQWTKISGPAGYSIADASAINTKVTFTQAGVYTFRVTLKDNKGNTATDDKVITVNGTGTTTTVTSPAKTAGALTANAGADETINLFWKYSPYLNGTLSTDKGGWFTSYKWTKVSGPAGYSIANASALNTRVSFTQTGIYTFRVTITDNQGNTASDDKVITVNP